MGKVTTPYTVSRCESCGGETRREFALGDCLFVKSECHCGGTALVEMIYGETAEM